MKRISKLEQINVDIDEIDIDELQELKADIDKKLSELQNKSNYMGIKNACSFEHASVKLSFGKQ